MRVTVGESHSWRESESARVTVGESRSRRESESVRVTVGESQCASNRRALRGVPRSPDPVHQDTGALWHRPHYSSFSETPWRCP